MNTTTLRLSRLALLASFAAACAPVGDDAPATAASELRQQSFDICTLFGQSALAGAIAGATIDQIGPIWVEPGTATILRGRHLDRLPSVMTAAYYSGTTRVVTSTRVYPMGPNAILVMAPRNVPAAGANVSIQLEYVRMCSESALSSPTLPGGFGSGSTGGLTVYTRQTYVLARSPATSSFVQPRFMLRTGGVMPAPVVSALAVGPNQIDLTWTDPGFDEIGFRIDYRQSGSPEWLAVGTVPSNRTREPIFGLQQATRYEFRVVPYDYDRDGAASNTAGATTGAVRVNAAAVTVQRSFSSAGGTAPLAGAALQPVMRAAVAYYDANQSRIVDGMPGGSTVFPYGPAAFGSWPFYGSVEGNRFDSTANVVVLAEFDKTAGALPMPGVNQFVAFHLELNGAVAALRGAVGGDYARGQGARIQTLVPTNSDTVRILQFTPPVGTARGRLRGSARANLMVMNEPLTQLVPLTSTLHQSDVQIDFDLEVIAR